MSKLQCARDGRTPERVPRPAVRRREADQILPTLPDAPRGHARGNGALRRGAGPVTKLPAHGANFQTPTTMPGFIEFLLIVGGVIFAFRLRAGDKREAEARMRQMERDLAAVRQEVVQLKAGAGSTTAPAAAPTLATGPTASVVTPMAAAAGGKTQPSSTPLTASPPGVAALRTAAETAQLPPVLPPLVALPEAATPLPATTAPVRPPPSPPPFAPPSPPKPAINWEQFVGVKLFAWLGGLAALFCVAYFIKYSFDHDLIPPAVRAALGFLLGIGLVVGGVLMNRERYRVTADTLCATGIVALYAVTFGCRSIYHFAAFTPEFCFAIMALITATGFVLAVRLRAQVVAILGMLGGFLTPLLLSTGQDNPLGLFGYLTILDVGLVAVALATGWEVLVPLGAVGTLMMQMGWATKFFAPEKLGTAVAVGLDFDVLFAVAFVLARRFGVNTRGFAFASALVSVCSLLAGIGWAGDSRLSSQPGLVFLLVVGADLCLLALVWLDAKLERLQLVAGGLMFLALSVWITTHRSPEMLPWALGMSLLFGILHAALPVVLKRRSPREYRMSWGHLFPPLALVLMMLPVVTRPVMSVLVWPFVFLVNLLAMGLAVVTGSLVSFALAIVVTLVLLVVAITKIPAELTGLPVTLLLIGGFALVFTAAALWLVRRLAGGAPVAKAGGTDGTKAPEGTEEWLPRLPAEITASLPALSAIAPFFLLVLLVGQLKLVNPSSVFGLVLLLAVLVLGLARLLKFDWLPAVGLAGVLLVEHAWFARSFSSDEQPGLVLGWLLGFAAWFALFPFTEKKARAGSVVPWAAAALAVPLHFGMIYKLVLQTWPNGFMGLLPAALAVPMLLALVVLVKRLAPDDPARLAVLAWFGGAALFFVTLIFPIQFDRQWLTISWALEGAALLWLFHRLPHPGLRLVGVALLAVCFARLTLNPAVFGYHPRSATPILNWYLYTYGVVTACLFAGASLLAPPRNVVLTRDAPPVLNTLGVVLAFLLVNIEIADYFTAPGAAALTFEFSGNLARDMSYSMAWAVFALGLLVVGIARKIPGARYASMALLCVTLLKLFFHDLARLSGLYRIGAILVVAVIAMLASFLYQRFLGTTGKK